ncbi:MAG: hypothetical protein M3N43_14790 [Actinomycetota bacterium]|nr:hypothetical protein [Actinomycetota bacterium]
MLRHAARIIEERGWCQTTMEDRAGRVCLLGGIVKSVGYQELGRAAHQFVMGQIGSAINFNDTHGRTAAEVIAALRAAADEADRG